MYLKYLFMFIVFTSGCFGENFASEENSEPKQFVQIVGREQKFDFRNGRAIYTITLSNNQSNEIIVPFENIENVIVPGPETTLELVGEYIFDDKPGFSSFEYATEDRSFTIECIAESVHPTPRPIKPPFIEDKTIRVVSSKRLVDLDKEEYYFEIHLNNGQVHKVKVSLEEALDNVLKPGSVLELLSETYISNNPGFSNFTYQIKDNSFVFKGDARSISSFWTPDPELHPLVTVTEVQWVPREMGFSYWLIKFSDNSTTSMSRRGSPPFAVGNPLFKAGHEIFVNFDSGDVIKYRDWIYSREYTIPVTW